MPGANKYKRSATTHLLRRPQDVRPKVLSYTGQKVRASQGTTVVALQSGWDHPVKFYWQNCAIFRAKFTDFTN